MGFAGLVLREGVGGILNVATAVVGLICCANSLIAFCDSSPFFKALPCQSALFSANAIPLPLNVFASRTVGRPLVLAAAVKAFSSAAWLWPSTTIAFQPNPAQRDL